MKRLMPALAGVIVLAAAAFPFQDRPAAADTRGELMRRLDGDIGRAMSNASLPEAQTKKLSLARQAISEYASSRNKRDRYLRDQLRYAVKDVQSVFKNKKTFRAEDRKAVLDDLEQIKKARILEEMPARQGARGPATTRPLPPPYPRGRRY